LTVEYLELCMKFSLTWKKVHDPTYYAKDETYYAK